jgi:hypothetical protein
MRSYIIAVTAGLFFAIGAVSAKAVPQNALESPPDAAYEAIASANTLIEGRSAYETPTSVYGGLGGNDLGNPIVNYGAPARAADFVGPEYTIRR